MKHELERRYPDRLREARERICAAFRFEPGLAPVVVNTSPYWLFGRHEDEIPPGYCGPDPSVMTDFQSREIERHFQIVDDDYVPYLMPWYGTAVLASAFGCPVKFEEKADPALAGQVLKDPEDVRVLPTPDPRRSGLMPRVLQTIDHMRRETDLPVGVTDCQGPLTTAVSLCGYDRLFYWMYDHPAVVHELMARVTDALIEWVAAQKERSGEARTECAGALGVWLPPGMGVWMSDDDAVLISAGLYEEFVLPYNARLLTAFGGGIVHFCGSAAHQADNFLRTDGLKGLNVFCMGDFTGLADLAAKVVQSSALGAEHRLVIVMGDYTPAGIPSYYRALVDHLPKSGVVYAPVITTGIALKDGKPVAARRPQADLAGQVREALRTALGDR